MSIVRIANKAKVSIATVSRTLNGSSHVNPETAAKVWKAVKELDYHPNIHARTLASGRSRTLGLIVSDIVNPFFPELVKSFEEIASERGYEIFVTSTNYNRARMQSVVKRFINRQVDGVAIMTSKMDAALVRELERQQIPLVMLDGTHRRKHIVNLKVDYRHGMSQAANHLLELGHTRIGFISGSLDVPSSVWRRDALLEYLRSVKVKVDAKHIETGNHKIDGGHAAMNRLLKLKKLPTAVIASNDLTAIGAMQAIRAHGLTIPHNISIIGFDDIEAAHYTDPPLTTVSLSRRQIAATAFQALMHSIEDSAAVSSSASDYLIPTQLIVRYSTATANNLAERPNKEI